jgi:hypothetical protein
MKPPKKMLMKKNSDDWDLPSVMPNRFLTVHPPKESYFDRVSRQSSKAILEDSFD